MMHTLRFSFSFQPPSTLETSHRRDIGTGSMSPDELYEQNAQNETNLSYFRFIKILQKIRYSLVIGNVSDYKLGGLSR